MKMGQTRKRNVGFKSCRDERDFLIKKSKKNARVVSNQNIWEVTLRICDLCTVKLGA